MVTKEILVQYADLRQEVVLFVRCKSIKITLKER